MKLRGLTRSCGAACCASFLSKAWWRIKRPIFLWMLRRSVVEVIHLREAKSINVKLSFMERDDPIERCITIPVVLSEHPYAHQAEWLAVHLEMEGCEGICPARRRVYLHPGLDISENEIPCIRGKSSSRKPEHQFRDV